MNYGELKTQFEGLLKRRDLTSTQRDIWLQQAIGRAQRVLRVPGMLTSSTITTDASGAPAVPADLLQLRAIIDPTTPTDLSARSLQEVMQARKNLVGFPPTMYTRQDGFYLLGPFPATGTSIVIEYYAAFSTLSADTDTNWLSTNAPDVIVYGALSLAGDWFIDKRAPVFEQRFEQFTQEVQDQADRDVLNNASMAPAGGSIYPDECSW